MYVFDQVLASPTYVCTACISYPRVHTVIMEQGEKGCDVGGGK
jgi:hypothetical protein